MNISSMRVNVVHQRPALTPRQIAAQKAAAEKRKAEVEAQAREEARETKFVRHFGAFEEATKQVGKRLPADGLGARYIHSAESFVKVTEGLIKGDKQNSLTVVRQDNEGDLKAFSGRSTGDLTDLVYTKYSFGNKPGGKVIEENFRVQPDGTAGQSISRFTLTPSSRNVQGSNGEDESQGLMSFSKLWSGVLGSEEAAPVASPAPSQNMEPMLDRSDSARLGELNRTFDELTDLALSNDGTHLDHDGKKDGKVNLAPLEAYAGILVGEERAVKVPKEGLAGAVGFKDEKFNPYTQLSTHGSVEANEDGLLSMDLFRQRVKTQDSEDIAALMPEVGEAHFHQRTEDNGTKVYEVKAQGKLERLVEESNGTISYFSTDDEMPELLNHDLPGFHHKARDPQTQEGFLNLAYLSHHQEIARLPLAEQPKAWADQSISNGIDPDYAIKSIQNYSLKRSQRVALRMTQREASEQSSSSAKLAIQKATLVAFRGTDSESPTLEDMSKTARALVDESRKEVGRDQELFLETGIRKLYTLAWRASNQEFKAALPTRPNALKDDPHFLAELLELG